MQLYKRGSTWWCSYQDADGRRIRRTTRCTDRAAAKAAAARLERAAHDPAYAAANATTLKAALERLLADRQTRGRAEGTLSMYKIKAGHLARLLGDATPLARITAREVDKFVEARQSEGASNNTIGKELTTLRSALKVAKRRGEFQADIAGVMPVQWSTGYKPRKRILRSGAELQALVDELPPDRGAHVCWLIATAARWSEGERARAGDINLDGGVVFVRGTKTDTSEALIPIVGPAWPLLEHALSVRGEERGPMFRPWRRAGAPGSSR